MGGNNSIIKLKLRSNGMIIIISISAFMMTINSPSNSKSGTIIAPRIKNQSERFVSVENEEEIFENNVAHRNGCYF